MCVDLNVFYVGHIMLSLVVIVDKLKYTRMHNNTAAEGTKTQIVYDRTTTHRYLFIFFVAIFFFLVLRLKFALILRVYTGFLS